MLYRFEFAQVDELWLFYLSCAFFELDHWLLQLSRSIFISLHWREWFLLLLVEILQLSVLDDHRRSTEPWVKELFLQPSWKQGWIWQNEIHLQWSYPELCFEEWYIFNNQTIQLSKVQSESIIILQGIIWDIPSLVLLKKLFVRFANRCIVMGNKLCEWGHWTIKFIFLRLWYTLTWTHYRNLI